MGRAYLPVTIVRGMALTVFAFATAVFLFLALSLSGTAYSGHDIFVHPDISGDDSTFDGPWHMTSRDNALSGHGNVLFAESTEVIVPPSIQRVIMSDTVIFTAPPPSLIDLVSGSVKTRFGWYMLVIAPNILLFMFIVKRIARETWSIPRIHIHTD